MSFRRRLVKYRKYVRLWIFGVVVILGGITGMLEYLEAQGVETYGDDLSVRCENCEWNFGIDVPFTVTNYLGQETAIKQLCFGRNFRLDLSGEKYLSNVGVYRADNRFREDNPARWKVFDFTGNCLNVGWNHFKVNATKHPDALVDLRINPEVEWLPIEPLINDNVRTCKLYNRTDYSRTGKCLNKTVYGNGTVECKLRELEGVVAKWCTQDGVLRVNDTEKDLPVGFIAVYAHSEINGTIRVDLVEEGGGWPTKDADSFRGCRDAGGYNCEIRWYVSKLQYDVVSVNSEEIIKNKLITKRVAVSVQ